VNYNVRVERWIETESEMCVVVVVVCPAVWD
jgi:hypothetical protein